MEWNACPLSERNDLALTNAAQVARKRSRRRRRSQVTDSHFAAKLPSSTPREVPKSERGKSKVSRAPERRITSFLRLTGCSSGEAKPCLHESGLSVVEVWVFRINKHAPSLLLGCVMDCHDVDEVVAQLYHCRPLLESVLHSPKEICDLVVIPGNDIELGRLVAPPGITASSVSTRIPVAVFPGQPLVMSVHLASSYPAADDVAATIAINLLERHLRVIARLDSGGRPCQQLPVSMCPNPGERALLISLAIHDDDDPRVSSLITPRTILLEELSLAGEPLLSAPRTIPIRVNHDVREMGPTWVAAESGDAEALHTALLEGGSTGEVHAGETCLGVAVRLGHVNAASALIRAGAHLIGGCRGSASYLHIAVQGEERRGCVAVLLAAPGIDVNAGDGTTAAGTPLHAAAENRSDFPCLLALLAAPGINVDARTSDGKTALHVAACRGNFDAVNALLQARADVNARSVAGETPLHTAGTAACVSALTAAPGVDANASTLHGYTPLHRAVSGGGRESVQCVKALLEAPGINPNATDVGGETPLHLAAIQGRADCVRALLAAPAVDPSIADMSGRTPRQLALDRMQQATAALLSMPRARAAQVSVGGAARTCVLQ